MDPKDLAARVGRKTDTISAVVEIVSAGTRPIPHAELGTRPQKNSIAQRG